MLLICKDAKGQFQFTENSEQNNVLIDLNSIEDQLDQGKKTEYLDIFTQVFESEQFKNTQQQIKDQIEWAYNLVQNYEYRDEEPKPPQSDDGYNCENDLLNQRYPDVHSTNLMLDNNIIKVRARVQLLQQTEQKNLLKAKILEKSAQKLITCKQNRYEKEVSRQQYERQMQIRLQQKQLSIQEQKERHNKILQEKKGKLGKIFQVRQAQTRDLKMRIKNDYQDTIRDIYYENKKSYERVKQIEEEHSAKLSKFFLDKQLFAQKNYQRKIEDEFYRTTLKQDELDYLERQENELLERIKKTQQIYQESSDRLQQIKQKSYRDIQNIS